MRCDKVKLENIQLSISGNAIISDLFLAVKKNEVALIFGESGSGKTSLLNIINFLYKPSAGTMYYDGVEINMNDRQKVDELRIHEIAFLHQELALIENITLIHNLRLFASIKGAELDDSVLFPACELLNISHLLDKDISVMSGGERQRSAFVKLLLFNYSLILMDEPTNNLDDKNINYIIQGIKNIKEQNNCTIIIVSHSKELMQVADSIYNMRELNHAE
jgi:putative ABC transport system ATP-binding protein